MQKIIVLIVSLLSTYAVAVAAQESERVPDHVLVYKEVGALELHMSIFLPEGHAVGDQRSAIVLFHGGGWTSGAPSTFYKHCEYLASRGMVAMSAEYRLISKHHTTPRECVMDGKSAIRWIRENARALGVDPDQIVAGGSSAGGHLAAATATTTGFEEAGEDLTVSSRPNALVLLDPVYDNGPGGFRHALVKDYWEAFSPMHNISETTPPTIVFLGTKDKYLPVETAKEYKRRMEAKGRRCDLHLYEGGRHGFYKSPKYYKETTIEMDRFLASLGLLEGEPTVQNTTGAGKG